MSFIGRKRGESIPLVILIVIICSIAFNLLQKKSESKLDIPNITEAYLSDYSSEVSIVDVFNMDLNPIS